MDVLVAYSGRAEATAAMARRLADGIRENGVGAVAVEIEDVSDLGPVCAVVVVGARRRGRWPRDLRRFLRRQRAELWRRPVWLVSAERHWPSTAASEGGVPVRHVCNLLAAVAAEGHARFDPDAENDDVRVASWARDVASFVLLHAPVSMEGWTCDGQASVEELDRSKAAALLRTQREGRLAALDGSRAVAVSVPYRVVGERIVLTAPAQVDLLRNCVRPVSLSVAGHDGGRWNVVVTGSLEPFGDGAVELVVARVTGRRRPAVRGEGAPGAPAISSCGTAPLPFRRSA